MKFWKHFLNGVLIISLLYAWIGIPIYAVTSMNNY